MKKKQDGHKGKAKQQEPRRRSEARIGEEKPEMRSKSLKEEGQGSPWREQEILHGRHSHAFSRRQPCCEEEDGGYKKQPPKAFLFSRPLGLKRKDNRYGEKEKEPHPVRKSAHQAWA